MSAPEPSYGDLSDPLIGRVVEGRFEIEKRLASGGMGVVYRATQRPLGRTVALKVIDVSAGGALDPNFQQRFFLEASAASQLGHPNTIVVHDYGRTEDGLYFMAMEYLGGQTLSQRFKASGALSPGDAVHVALQIAGSLREAHAQGLVHRDLKPGNIMFAPRGGDPTFVKVLDFGLVKVLSEDKSKVGLTQSGMLMGSPRYMAPEQVKTQAVDARADVYSFGAVFHHMLTGRPPFDGESAFEAMNHHVFTAPPRLRDVAPELAAYPALEELALRCLAKEPDARPSGMDEIIQALRAAQTPAMGAASSGASAYLTRPDGPLPSSLVSAAQHPGVAAPAAPVAPAAQPAGSDGGGGSQKTVRLDTELELPTGAWTNYSSPGGQPAAAPAPQPQGAPPARQSRGLIIAAGIAGGLLVMGAIAAAALIVPRLIAPRADLADPGGSASNTQRPVAATALNEPLAAPEPSEPGDPSAAAPASDAVEAVEATAGSEPPAPALPPGTTLRSDPAGALVHRGEEALGDTPIELRVPAGERWAVTLSRSGYVDRNVTLAAGARDLLIHLEREPAPQPVARRRGRTPAPTPEVRPLGHSATPRPAGRRGRRGGQTPDLDDPWRD